MPASQLLASCAKHASIVVVASLHVAIVANPAVVTFAIVTASVVIVTTQAVATACHFVAPVHCKMEKIKNRI